MRIRWGNLYIEGKLQLRKWTDNEGTPKAITEIVLDDMVLLDSKPQGASANHQSKDKQVANPMCKFLRRATILLV